MRHIISLIVYFTLFTSCETEEKGWIDLLNYEDFSNWSVFVLKPDQQGVSEVEMQDPPEWLLPKVYLTTDPDSSVFSYQFHDGKKNNSREKLGSELTPLTRGAIKIQSEGGEQYVEYIRIKRIDEIPQEFKTCIRQ